MKINRRELLIAGTGLAGGMLLPDGLRQMANAAVAAPGWDRPQGAGHPGIIRSSIRSIRSRLCPSGTAASRSPPMSPGCRLSRRITKNNSRSAPPLIGPGIPSRPRAGVKAEDFRFKEFDAHGREVGYATDSAGQQVLFDWLRQNPHRLHLGRIGLLLKRSDGTVANSADIKSINQTLDLWTGTILSRFEFEGEPISVRTCCHPDHDAMAIRIESALLGKGSAALQIAFPYGSPEIDMADWKSADKHQTTCAIKGQRADFSRSLDQYRYSAALAWNDGRFEQTAPHEFVLHGTGDTLECVMRFSLAADITELPSADATFQASESHWENFWSTGGAMDLSGSTDPRANELERRIVLSQYNTALHCAGPMPPQETGLLFNSWFGKSHLEMHWWHGVHFAAWGRSPLFERSLDYYHRILPVARAIAVRQGYEGVRWPKMVDAEGHDSPSPVAPLLIWQQPHPIYYAEMCFSRAPASATLTKWSEIVFETAKFMASYAFLDQDRYVLGPPLKTVSENTDAHTTHNPTFELAYWRYGLTIAQQWRQRMGLPPDPKWADVLTRLSPLPTQDGLYLMQEGMTDTFTQWNWEHPALLGALGVTAGLRRRSRNHAPHLEKSDGGLGLGPLLGLGFSDGGDDRCQIG